MHFPVQRLGKNPKILCIDDIFVIKYEVSLEDFFFLLSSSFYFSSFIPFCTTDLLGSIADSHRIFLKMFYSLKVLIPLFISKLQFPATRH